MNNDVSVLVINPEMRVGALCDTGLVPLIMTRMNDQCTVIFVLYGLGSHVISVYTHDLWSRIKINPIDSYTY